METQQQEHIDTLLFSSNRLLFPRIQKHPQSHSQLTFIAARWEDRDEVTVIIHHDSMHHHFTFNTHAQPNKSPTDWITHPTQQHHQNILRHHFSAQSDILAGYLLRVEGRGRHQAQYIVPRSCVLLWDCFRCNWIGKFCVNNNTFCQCWHTAKRDIINVACGDSLCQIYSVDTFLNKNTNNIQIT